MTTRRTVSAANAAETQPALRRCIGSVKFGIGAHEAPISDFPVQASQKDGLGRMCKPHWNQYTAALRKAALARKAASGEPTLDSEAVATVATKRSARVGNNDREPIAREAAAGEAERPTSRKTPKRDGAQFPAGGSQGDAG